MASLNLQNPSSTSLATLRLQEPWYVRHSTRAIWQGTRNVQVEGSHNNSSLPVEALSYTYQEKINSKVKTRVEVDWKFLGQGKDGKLESWMRETEYGIEDSSGEVRADSRSTWIVIYFPATSQPHARAEIDILCSREAGVSDGTIKEIGAAFKALSGRHGEVVNVDIRPVHRDSARDQEMKEKEEARYKKWEKRTGPEAGISPDLIYDD